MGQLNISKILLLIIPLTLVVKGRPSWTEIHAKCVSNEDCDKVVETCENDLCQCRPGTTWSMDKYRCLLVANEACDVNRPLCAPNSECRLTDPCRHSNEDHCLQVYNCTCLDTFYEEEASGLCVHGHHESCATSRDCDSEFVCKSGVCICPRGEYDEISETCRIHHGGECGEHKSCMPTLICEEHDTEFAVSVCHCPEGSRLMGNVCSVGFGARCDAINELPCNTDVGLTCRDGTCQCLHPSGQVFNEILGVCISLETGPCVPHLDDDESDGKIGLCVSGTYCEPLIGHTNAGVCKNLLKISHHDNWTIAGVTVVIVVLVGVIAIGGWIHYISPWLRRKKNEAESTNDAVVEDPNNLTLLTLTRKPRD